MKTVFSFADFPQYKNMLDNIDGLVNFGTAQDIWPLKSSVADLPLNAAVCDSIVTTLEELVETRPAHNALARWETAFVIAQKYLSALDQKLIELDPAAQMQGSLKDQIVTRARAVNRILNYTTAEIEANLVLEPQGQLKQGYDALCATYLPTIAERQTSIERVYSQTYGAQGPKDAKQAPLSLTR